MKVLQAYGYLVVRSAGSKGPVDLVGLHSLSRPLLVQAKTGGNVTHEEWNDLLSLARDVNATPLILKWRPDHRGLVWVNLMGFHVSGSKYWSNVEWKPSQAVNLVEAP